MPCPPRIGLCWACGLLKGAANQEPPSDLGMVSLTPPRGLACAIFPNGRDVSNRASNAPSFALRTAYQPQFSPLFLRGRITDLRAGTHRDGPSSGDDQTPAPGTIPYWAEYMSGGCFLRPPAMVEVRDGKAKIPKILERAVLVYFGLHFSASGAWISTSARQ